MAPEVSTDEEDLFSALSPKAKCQRTQQQKSAVVAVMNEQYNPKQHDKIASPGVVGGTTNTSHPGRFWLYEKLDNKMHRLLWVSVKKYASYLNIQAFKNLSARRK